MASKQATSNTVVSDMNHLTRKELIQKAILKAKPVQSKKTHLVRVNDKTWIAVSPTKRNEQSIVETWQHNYLESAKKLKF